MTTMSVNELRSIMCKNNYLAARYTCGNVVGINCKIVEHKRMAEKPNVQTQIIGVYPIDFMEYIRIKIPFITKLWQSY